MSARHQVDELRRLNNGSTAVPGHGLMREGMPYADNGTLRQYHWDGRGKCSCGAVSAWLRSNNHRKAWHRQHKLGVLAGADTA